MAKWLDELDSVARARIQARIFRFEAGNLGDVEPVGGGVIEAKFNFGAGYRVYFGLAAGHLVLLLLGGNKKTQKRDIEQAKSYWTEWKENHQHG